MSFLKTMFGDLKTGSLRRLPYFFFSLIYIGGIVVTANYFAKTVFMPPRGSTIVIVAMLFLTYILFVLMTKRLRHLGFKRPILMSAFLSWSGFLTGFGIFLSQRFMLDDALPKILTVIALCIVCVWISLMVLFIPLLLFARESFFKQNLSKLFLGDLRQGELQRIPYLGCSLYLVSLFYGGLLLLLSLVGVFLGGGAQLLQLTMSPESLSALSSSIFSEVGSSVALIVLYLALLCFYLLILYASFVLMFKRMRNIGLKRPILTFVLSFIGMIILMILLGVLGVPIALMILYVFVFYLYLGLYFLPQGFIQQRPLRVLFADIKKGSLRRVAFFGYVILAFLITSIFGAFMGFDMMTGPGIWSILGILLFEYMGFVLTVKRLRHINFKSPIALALIIFVSDLIFYGLGYSGYELILSESLRLGWLCVDVIIFLVLLFTPGNFFRQNQKPDKTESVTY